VRKLRSRQKARAWVRRVLIRVKPKDQGLVKRFKRLEKPAEPKEKKPEQLAEQKNDKLVKKPEKLAEPSVELPARNVGGLGRKVTSRSLLPPRMVVL
jgi:hypothetical protein